MSDRAVLAMAAAAWIGAWTAIPVPLWAGVLLACVAFALRRPWLLCLAVLLGAGSLSVAARAGLAGLSDGVIDDDITMLTDPETFGRAVRFEARLGDRHVEAWAEGSVGEQALEHLAGEHLVVRGRVEAFDSFDGRRLSRHLSGRLDVLGIVGSSPGSTVSRLANGYRSLLVTGSGRLDADERSLLAGLVLGDDRAQSPALIDAFRGAGLTHLLAVSGQNVAFVLIVIEPALRRLPGRARAVLAIGALGAFGVITRFEPSVLRAVAMAGVAIMAAARGQPASGRRALGLAVAGLLLIDPLLVHSIGFQLSVAASFGILTWSASVAEWLPLPSWLARPIGVIVAAQLSVAPLLVLTFGPLPLASLPANVLAGPAAGPAMVWGMTGGVVAGVLPVTSSVLHLPTRALLGWIEVIARMLSAAPLGGLTAWTMVLLVAGLRVVSGPNRRPWLRTVGGVMAGVGVVAPLAAALLAPVPLRTSVTGATIWRSGSTTVLVLHEPTRPVDLLAGLRRARVRGLDLIAVDGPVDASVVDALRDRFGAVSLLGEPGPPGSVVTVGSLAVVVRASGADPVIDVVPAGVRSPGASGARAPPL